MEMLSKSAANICLKKESLMNSIIEAVKQGIDVSNGKNPIGAHMKTGVSNTF